MDHKEELLSKMVNEAESLAEHMAKFYRMTGKFPVITFEYTEYKNTSCGDIGVVRATVREQGNDSFSGVS